MHLNTLLLDTSKAQLASVSDPCRHHRQITATTAGSVHTVTVRYQDKPPHTQRSGEGSASHRAREHGALSHLDDGRDDGMGIDCCSGTTRRAARCITTPGTGAHTVCRKSSHTGGTPPHATQASRLPPQGLTAQRPRGPQDTCTHAKMTPQHALHTT